VYFQQKDSCTNTYSDAHTTACSVIDNGSGGSVATSMTLRDAIYLYGQGVNAKGSKVLTGNNCDVFQLILSVNTGYTDLAMGQADTFAHAVSGQTAYPDRIHSTDAMFSYSLYASQAVKTFSFNDKNTPTLPTQIGVTTMFGYCYSTIPGANVYIHEGDRCLNTYSNGSSVAATCD
jgi:hypothetical protein